MYARNLVLYIHYSDYLFQIAAGGYGPKAVGSWVSMYAVRVSNRNNGAMGAIFCNTGKTRTARFEKDQ